VPRVTRTLAILVLAVLAIAAGAELLLDKPSSIDVYRVVDQRTLVLVTHSGWLDWTRVTSVVETPTSVTIQLKDFRWDFFLPGTGGQPTDFTVTLSAPLGDRQVIDASTGQPIRRQQSDPASVASPSPLVSAPPLESLAAGTCLDQPWPPYGVPGTEPGTSVSRPTRSASAPERRGDPVGCAA